MLVSLFDSGNEEYFLLVYLFFFLCLFFSGMQPDPFFCLLLFLFFNLFSFAFWLSLALWSEDNLLCLPSPHWSEYSEFHSKVCSWSILLAYSSILIYFDWSVWYLKLSLLCSCLLRKDYWKWKRKRDHVWSRD